MKTQHQQGFSLLEVLVAFAIMAIALGTVLQVFATGLRNTALTEEYSLAAMHAESVLASIGTEINLEEASGAALSGELDEQFSWRAQVTEYIEDEEQAPDPLQARAIPYLVSVEVYWQSAKQTRSVILDSLRLASTEKRR